MAGLYGACMNIPLPLDQNIFSNMQLLSWLHLSYLTYLASQTTPYSTTLLGKLF